MPPLLIVNADDWGGTPVATDRIAECFAAGSLTSTTAMMYMSDSDRAASIARERGLPAGLHLNITQEFDGSRVPSAVRDRQRRLVERLAHPAARYDLRLTHDVRRVVSDQLERFRDSYGCEPTHLDGHNHAHLKPIVLLALPRMVRLRPPHTTSPARSRIPRLLRDLRHAAIARRFLTPEYFFAIGRVHDSLGQAERTDALALSRQHSVEIMTHPDRPAEHALLLSPDWQERLIGLPLGSYAQLSR